MLRHCKIWSVACRARVKQVKRWTYPNLVSVPLCTKLEMSDINSGNQGSPWASSIATLYHPPVGNEELRLSFLLAHCIANGEKRLTVLLSVCAFPLP